jgi:hypothetical protein
MSEYDNTNRGSLWKAKGFAGKLNIAGVDYNVLLVSTGAKSEKAPAYKAIMSRDMVDKVFPVWREKKEGSNRAGYFETESAYVSLYVNESNNEMAPILKLSAQAKRAEREPFVDNVQNLPQDDPPF